MAASRKDKAHRSPPCDITRATITIKGHGDLSSIENQARVVAALLGLPQPTDFSSLGRVCKGFGDQELATDNV